MRLHMRTYQGKDDYWRIWGFLRGLSLLNNRHDYAWSFLLWMAYWLPSTMTRTAVLEPIGTPLDHQKHGLGKVVMTEGLHRAEDLVPPFQPLVHTESLPTLCTHR